jgi:hypothetical protein
MTSRQPLRSAVAFLAFVAHNVEEALMAPSWALANIDLLMQYTRRGLVEAWAGATFRFSLLALTLALLVLAVASARAPKRGASVYLLLAALSVFAANALVPHITGAFLLKAYVPGVITAALVVLPVASWVYVSTIREGFATLRGSYLAAIAGIVLYAAVAGLAVSL